jgi:DNA-binding CsgD family transcriptional regulator
MSTVPPAETALLDLLYLATADTAARTQFLAALATRFHAPCSGLIKTNTVSDEAGLALHPTEFEDQFGMPAESLQLYRGYYATRDPWFLACRERRLSEWVGAGSAICPPARFEQTEFYNDFFRPLRFPGFYQLGALISPAHGQQAVLTVLRERQRKDFDENEIQALHALVPHLRRALQIDAKLASLRTLAGGTGAVLASLDVALIALDRAGRVCFLNGLAESILSAGNALRLHNGRLVAAQAGESAALQRMVDTTAAGPRGGQPLGGRLTIHSRERSIYLTVLPLAATVTHVPDQACVLMTVSLDSTPRPRDRALATLFGLTPAEIRVTMLLVQGLEPKEISARTAATYETVRFQLKSIYKKMNVTRQSQLVRLVSLLPGSF